MNGTANRRMQHHILRVLRCSTDIWPQVWSWAGMHDGEYLEGLFVIFNHW